MSRSTHAPSVLPRYHVDNTFTPEEGTSLPVAKSDSPLLSRRLQQCCALFQKGLRCHEHVIVATFIIKLPDDDRFQDDLGSSDCLSRFLLAVKSRIRKDSQSDSASHSSPVWHIASRDYHHPDVAPRLHIVLIMDGTLYPSRVTHEDHEQKLLIQIRESLASVLNIPFTETQRHVLYRANRCGIHLHRFASIDDDGFSQAFLHTSQLCAKRSRMPGQSFRGFLMSRAS